MSENLVHFSIQSKIMKRILLSFLSAALLAGCQTENKVATDDALADKARDLASKLIIVDGHVDLPYRLKVKHFRLEREYMGIPVSSREGDFDYERARAGGLDAPFMAIYIPKDQQLYPDMGKALADSLIDMVNGIVKAHPDKFAAAESPADMH